MYMGSNINITPQPHPMLPGGFLQSLQKMLGPLCGCVCVCVCMCMCVCGEQWVQEYGEWWWDQCPKSRDPPFTIHPVPTTHHCACAMYRGPSYLMQDKGIQDHNCPLKWTCPLLEKPLGRLSWVGAVFVTMNLNIYSTAWKEKKSPTPDRFKMNIYKLKKTLVLCTLHYTTIRLII